MKFRSHIIVTAVALWATAVSCEKDPIVPLRDIVFSGAPERIMAGDSVQFVVDCVPADYNCNEPTAAKQWTSSRPTVASVSANGVVRGLAAGRTEIKVVWGGFVRSALLEVDAPTTITDPIFLQFCLEHFDTDHDGILQQIEITSVESIDLTEVVPYHPRLSLQGIEAFSGLKYLNLSFLELADVDLSHNKLLRRLVCDNTDIETLDLSQNTLLKEVDCHSCANLHTLVLPGEAGNELNILACFDCQLSNLDLSQNTQLEYIDCRQNRLTRIDVAAQPLLWQLSCSGNNISEIVFAPDFDMQQLKVFDR